ncbi:response regulator [Streptomyces sp. NPDC008343]|uniref:response regulator n=1 Tax=Streptomyces sp. NPDC008343 TaxID=3364828 RepID=UPI0036E507E7
MVTASGAGNTLWQALSDSQGTIFGARQLGLGQTGLAILTAVGAVVVLIAALTVALVQRLARYAAAEQQLRERTRELDERNASLSLLHQVSAAANKATGWDEALGTILPLIARSMHWPIGQAWLASSGPNHETDGSPVLTASGSRYIDEQSAEPLQEIADLLCRTPGGLPATVQTTGRPRWLHDITDDPDAGENLAGHAGVTGRLAVPVMLGADVPAVLDFLTLDGPAPAEHTLTLLLNLGAQLGSVLERERAAAALRLARQTAEDATRGKSAFLATMSHEIRTPLNAVIGMTELLQDTELTSEQRGFVSTISTSSEALLVVINDVLDFSKIEAGRLELESRAFLVQDCVESALDLVAARAAEKSLEVACLLDPDVPQAVVGDSIRLRQILANLLTNAVKFTDAGQVVVRVGSVAGPPEQHELRFSVSDTGIGIPADRMDRLFREFSQIDASTRRRYEGTGLGLAISKRLAELMGGTMWVESQVGSGSTFSFTISAEPTTSLPPRYTAAANASLLGKRVLIVDDNAVNREVVRRQTASWGMVPRETESPLQALEWVRHGDPFDIGVLDLVMPEMDGITLAHEIRRRRGAQDLPLVMLSSLGQLKDEPTEELFAAFQLKPVKASQLHDALLTALHASAVPEPSPPQGALWPQPQPLRILLTEDNPVNQQVALLMLGRLGYRADVASNGVEALAALERASYDVVLMDVEMPEMDGLEASRQIHRRWPRNDRPRIIGMTANVMRGDREACLAAGMNDYLAKPIRRESLAAALARTTPQAPSAVDEPGDQQPVVDPAAIDELRQAVGDESVVTELIDAFFAEAPAQLQRLHSQDIDELRRSAHTLKSNVRSFGAKKLGELCAQMEADARAGDTSTAEDLAAHIEAEYERVHAALVSFRKET